MRTISDVDDKWVAVKEANLEPILFYFKLQYSIFYSITKNSITLNQVQERYLHFIIFQCTSTTGTLFSYITIIMYLTNTDNAPQLLIQKLLNWQFPTKTDTWFIQVDKAKTIMWLPLIYTIVLLPIGCKFQINEFSEWVLCNIVIPDCESHKTKFTENSCHFHSDFSWRPIRTLLPQQCIPQRPNVLPRGLIIFNINSIEHEIRRISRCIITIE